jgi:hypothetical protein
VGPGETDVCNEPGVVHILWNYDLESGFACEEHREEALTKWSHYRYHPVGAYCGEDTGLFYDKTNECGVA